jgi:hypothetical protein
MWRTPFEELELEPRTIGTCGEWVLVDVKVSGHASSVALETDVTRCASRPNGGQTWVRGNPMPTRTARHGGPFIQLMAGAVAPPDDLGPESGVASGQRTPGDNPKG